MNGAVWDRVDKMEISVLKRLFYGLLMRVATKKKTHEEYLAGFENVHPVEYYAMNCIDGLLNYVEEGKDD